jgi:3-dehydroquinate synthase
MKTVDVNLGERGYRILISEGQLAEAGKAFVDAGISGRVFIVANPQVFDLYGELLTESLAAQGLQVVNLMIPDGEPSKNLHTVENIYTYLIAQRADRQSTLIALGGGVTGDVVGFVAATFLRGIRYVQVPTTLLAQVDSSVGGKTGVNHRLGKNLIGAFYQPHLVCIDTRTLASLPPREFRAGIFEIIKYGLIYDAAFFEYLEANLGALIAGESSVLETVIGRCCEIKAEVISIDEKESNLRRILNFGHTLGHALEAATGYERFKHGEAVAYGMIAAACLSERQGSLNKGSLKRICSLVTKVGPLPSAADIAFEQLEEGMMRDKKRLEDQVVFVLLDGIGATRIVSGFDSQLLSEVWACALAEVEV